MYFLFSLIRAFFIKKKGVRLVGFLTNAARRILGIDFGRKRPKLDSFLH
jgi:hypothetical protein